MSTDVIPTPSAVLPRDRLARRAEIVESVRSSVTRWAKWIESIHAPMADAYATDLETCEYLEAELLRLAPDSQEYRRVAQASARSRRSAAAWAVKLSITPKAMKSAPKEVVGPLGTGSGGSIFDALREPGAALDPARTRQVDDPDECEWRGTPPAVGAGCSKGVCDSCPMTAR